MPAAARLGTTLTRPRRTAVTVPLQRSVTVKVGRRPLIAIVRLAPPTARKAPPAVIVSDRTASALRRATHLTWPLGPCRAHERGSRHDRPVRPPARPGLEDREDAGPEPREAAAHDAPLGRRVHGRGETASPPRRASKVEPTGTVATPLSGTKPASWNGTRNPVVKAPEAPGASFTNTSPKSSRTVILRPAAAVDRSGRQGLAGVADGRGRHRSGPGCSRPGQLSRASGTPVGIRVDPVQDAVAVDVGASGTPSPLASFCARSRFGSTGVYVRRAPAVDRRRRRRVRAIGQPGVGDGASAWRRRGAVGGGPVCGWSLAVKANVTSPLGIVVQRARR